MPSKTITIYGRGLHHDVMFGYGTTTLDKVAREIYEKIENMLSNMDEINFECHFNELDDYFKCQKQAFKYVERIGSKIEKELPHIIREVQQKYSDVEIKHYVEVVQEDTEGIVMIEVYIKHGHELARLSWEIWLFDDENMFGFEITYRNAIYYIPEDVKLDLEFLTQLPMPASADREEEFRVHID